MPSKKQNKLDGLAEKAFKDVVSYAHKNCSKEHYEKIMKLVMKVTATQRKATSNFVREIRI